MKSPSADSEFFPRRQKKTALRVWAWRENPRITIRERRNASGGVGYRVTFPIAVTGCQPLLLQSKSFDEAKQIARSRGRDFRQSRSTALVLGDAEKIQAASALRMLEDRGIRRPLDQVVRQYCEADALLRGHGLQIEEAAKLLEAGIQTIVPTGKPLPEVLEYAVKRLCPEGGSKTLAELAAELTEIKRGWFKRGDLRPDSMRDFENRAGKITADIGEIPLSELTKEEICQWLSGLKLAPRTVKNYRMVLAEMLRYAQQKRYLVTNPIDELTRQDIKEIEGRGHEARQPAILSPAQAEHLLTTAFKRPDLNLGAAVVLGLFCGIRTEELKRLKWDAVRLNEEHPLVVIGPEIAKKRRIRNVPIPECAVAWLQAWPRTGEMLTRSAHANDYQKRFKKLCREAKISWESNAMRHSFGSYDFALSGNSIETARKLGHKQDDSVLFAHYRTLATKEQGAAYFSKVPKQDGTMISFPSASAQ